jgi:hypothetical protein
MRRFGTRLLKLERDQPAPPDPERERIEAIGRALKALWRMGFVWASEAMAAGVPVTDDQKAIERWYVAFTLASTPPGLEQNDRWRRELLDELAGLGVSEAEALRMEAELGIDHGRVE